MKPHMMPIYIQVPEKEYKLFKVFCIQNNMTMQMFLRNSAKYFISETQKAKREKSDKDV